MRVTAALLCDHATVREGLLHVLGGCITRLWREQLPAGMGVALALVIEVTQEETAVPHEIQIWVRDRDGKQVAEVMGGFELTPGPRTERGENLLTPIAIPLQGVGLEQYGKHVVSLAVDAQIVHELEFWVLHPDEQVLPVVHLPEPPPE